MGAELRQAALLPMEPAAMAVMALPMVQRPGVEQRPMVGQPQEQQRPLVEPRQPTTDSTSPMA
jgi:hypothetical protein